MKTRSLPGPLALAILTFPLVATSLRAEILEDRLQTNLVPIQYGPGTTRLDGMGLSLAARDENNEINLFDYGENPAGLLADRDAWSVDVRLAHRERVERNPSLSGFDFRGNTYSLLAGYRKTGVQAFAGGIDYFDSKLKQRETINPEYANLGTQYENIQYRFLYNRMISRAAVGFEFRYASETEDLENPNRIYYIEHGTDSFVGRLGVSYDVHPWVTVAGLGALTRSNVTGEAAADDHLDVFDWDRPSGTAQGQVYVHHPRLQGAVVIGRNEGAGREDVAIGWSPLFPFNPSTRFVRFESEVFTEKREASSVKTRWDFDLIPRVAVLSASWNDQTSKYEIRTIPTVLGSRQPLQNQFDASDVAVGGSLYLFNQRLFLGSEVHHQEQTYTNIDDTDLYATQLKLTSLNFGTEYLLFENFAARGGLGFRTEDRSDSRDPGETSGATGSHGATTASLGFGLVPSGGILQLDAAYSLDLNSGWDIDQNSFSLYARLLF